MFSSPINICSRLGFLNSTSVRSYISTAPSGHLLRLLQLSIDNHSLRFASQSHAQIIYLGFHEDSFFATKLITAYSLCRSPCNARSVFDSVPHKNVFVWNSLINGYAKNHIFGEPFSLFSRMCRGRLPDNYTFATLSKICGEMEGLYTGKMIHCHIVKTGFGSDTIVSNSVIAMYCKCRRFSDAREMFGQMPHRNVGSWNVLISECGSLGDYVFNEEIYELVKQMQIEGVKPDAFTIASLLPLCTNMDRDSFHYGKELHCLIIKNEIDSELESSLHLGSCLIDMYSKNNRVAMGRYIFNRMKCKNVVCWTAMLTGYVQNGNAEEGITLFRSMQVVDLIVPNRVSLISVLPACGSLASLIQGKQIHCFTFRSHLNSDVSVKNALVDMYSKCGSLKCARSVFDYHSCVNDVISWSSMIAGYGLHGRGDEALMLFKDMCQLGIRPDYITFVGVISACGRVGLVDEGLEIYSLLVADYGMLPTREICSCMVDMLGRAGQLNRALDFINTMPVKPGPSVWGAFLSASVIHGNLKTQDLAYQSLLALEPESPSNYVSVSNGLASFGKWDVVAEVRTQMKERGLRKLPGCSWISVNNKIHSFCVADKSHPCSELIYATLGNLILTMKAVFVPDFEHMA